MFDFFKKNIASCKAKFFGLTQWNRDKEKAYRMIEEPAPDQARVLAVFDYEVERGVLQKIKR